MSLCLALPDDQPTEAPVWLCLWHPRSPDSEAVLLAGAGFGDRCLLPVFSCVLQVLSKTFRLDLVSSCSFFEARVFQGAHGAAVEVNDSRY